MRWFQRRRDEPQQAARLRPYDVLVFPIVDWQYLFQRPQHLSREFARRGHRVFYLSTTFQPELCLWDPGAKEVEPNIFLVTLPGSENPPDIYRDLPSELQLAAMEFGLRRLRETHELGATLSIVDYPFWAPLARKLNLRWEIHYRDQLDRVALFVSKQSHCLFDLLWRSAEGELPCEIALVISNHADLAPAVEKFGIPFTLSTMSICSIEDIAAHTRAPFWFQLYVMKDRDFIERLIDRAKAANCSALMLTLDLQILGQRHKDLKNGLSAPPKPTLANLINLATKPSWCMGMLGTRRRSFGNIVGHAKGVSDLSSLSSWTAEQFDPRLSWDDVEWIKQRWGGKLIIKGILDVEDAQLAANSGADALIVSNHGGRQLDGAQSSIEALPAIAAEVGSKIEVHMDGGIRSGQDVLKAVALGAKGTYIGRAMLYGLGAMGEAGVRAALSIIHKELDLTMAFCGRTRIEQVDRTILLPGTFPS